MDVMEHFVVVNMPSLGHASTHTYLHGYKLRAFSQKRYVEIDFTSFLVNWKFGIFTLLFKRTFKNIIVSYTNYEKIISYNFIFLT